MHFSFMRVLAISAALFLAFASPSCAATATVVQALTFGKWYMGHNNSVYDVSVDTDGSVSHSPGLVMIATPRPGIYDISGLDPNMTVNSINVTQAQPLDAGGSETLQMDNFQTDSSGVTDGAGHMTVTIGARMRTSGSGTGFGNNLYTGTLQLEFNM